MHFNPFNAGDDTDVVFRDVIMLALAGFVMLVLLLLPHLNPPIKPQDEVQPQGNVLVEIRWQDGINVDVDLWVQAPGDRPVGYSNASGTIFNLLRDDLGSTGDLGGLNMEMAYSRGAPEGEYTVNVHLYRDDGSGQPVPVQVVVSLRAGPGSPPTKIFAGEVVLKHVGEEITVVRFSLDDDGKLVPNSLNDIPKPLRSAARW